MQDIVVGMKMEWKLSKFSVKKWKQNEDMETKIELCKTEMETEFFWWKWKWKWNNVF
jgi:hypothetical protein